MDIAVDWAAEEGWNPGLPDADCYYAADPQGFFIGFLGADPIATISAVRYNQTAEALAKRHNMNVMFETARMYTGPEPAMPLSRIFGITSFEIG